MKLVQPQFVMDGQIVWLKWDREKNTVLKCQVAVAAGNTARVVNELHKLDKWVRIESLRIEVEEQETKVL